MAKGHNSKGRSKYPDRFMPVFYYFFECPAWRSLDTYARSVYSELRYRYNGRNNGAISASTRELAKAINCSDKPITRALRELEERGFIVSIQKGSFNWKTRIDSNEKNRASVWLLTELPQDEPERSLTARKDFMKWKPTNNKDQEKNAVVSEPPYCRTSAVTKKPMVVPERLAVVPERPLSTNTDDEWSPSNDTYNIPYTLPKNINGMGG